MRRMDGRRGLEREFEGNGGEQVRLHHQSRRREKSHNATLSVLRPKPLYKTATVDWATFLCLELSRVRKCVLTKGYILLSSNHQVHFAYYTQYFDKSRYKTEQVLIKIIDLWTRSKVFLNLHFTGKRPILQPDLYFSSCTPVKQPCMINNP